MTLAGGKKTARLCGDSVAPAPAGETGTGPAHGAGGKRRAASPADLQAQVAARLKNIYGAGLDIDVRVNPALIGGLRIQVGSDLYDGSVKTRLEKLQQSF